MQIRKTTFIYGLLDPESYKIRYIGKADRPKSRYSAHLSDPYKNHKANWVRSLLAQGKKPVLRILQEVGIDEWKFYENYWITELRANGVNLTNNTNGGEGCDGYKHTTEHKQHIAKVQHLRWKDKEARHKQSETIKLSMDNPEFRKSRSARCKEVFNRPEIKAMLSANTTRAFQKEDVRERHRKACQKRSSSQGYRDKLSESLKPIFADPQYRKNLSDGVKLAYSNPDLLKQCSENAKRRWADPEFRARMCLINKAAAVKREENRRLKNGMIYNAN